MSDKIVHVTDETFEGDVLGAEGPVLVDYWAEWCGPCKVIAPVLEEIAEEYAGKLKIAKLNIDENPGTPPKYGIRGIPTLMYRNPSFLRLLIVTYKFKPCYFTNIGGEGPL
jgi:thioredoxin 1